MHTREDLSRVDLEVLQLLQDALMILHRGHAAQFIVETEILEAGNELGATLLAGAFNNDAVDQEKGCMTHFEVPLSV